VLQSPFQNISKSKEKKLTIVLLILLVILIFVMRYLDTQIQNNNNSGGIIAFELAKDLSNSEAILKSWNTFSKISAGLSLGIDFLFLTVYSLFISLIIHKLNEQLWRDSIIYSIGLALIWGVFLAAFFDIIENIALIKLLLGDLQQKWSSIAYYAAISKFTLLAIGLFFILVNLIIYIFKKWFKINN
jgi:hypothetical protein